MFKNNKKYKKPLKNHTTKPIAAVFSHPSITFNTATAQALP